LSLATSPEGYDDGKQRWLYAASEPNLTTIGMHSLSPGPFPCNTLPRAGRAVFLLDQYGWSQVAFRSIRTILDQLQKAEVFLTFSVDALIDYLSVRSLEMRAFGEIDVDPGLVCELIQVRQDEQVGYRVLIQNSLYSHVQSATRAPFYSPFFIKSPDAHRSYWFIHLSKHREARNEIGMIHWKENNTTIHHGGAGLHALGFTPGANIEQMTWNISLTSPQRQCPAQS
jgi:hypothetical protein